MKKLSIAICMLSFVVAQPGWGLTTIFYETMGMVSVTTPLATHEAANGFDNDAYTMSGGGANPGDVRATDASSGYTNPAGNMASGSANIWLTNTRGDFGFGIAGIDAASFTGLRLSFGYRKISSVSNAQFVVQWSTNGSMWNNITLAQLPPTNAATGWRMLTNMTLAAGASSTNLSLRWVKSATIGLRIDDVLLQGESLAGTPMDPSNLTATAVGTSQVDVAWALNPSGNDVLLAYNTNSAFGAPSGTYSVGQPIAGGGTVLANGSGTDYIHTGLIPLRKYYYMAFSVTNTPAYSLGVMTFANTPDWNFPGITVTNPSGGSGNVPNAVTTYDLKGFSSNLVGEIVWSNLLTQIGGTMPAAASWSIAGIALGVGINTIAVSGANDNGTAITTTGIVQRFASGMGGNPMDIGGFAVRQYTSSQTYTIPTGTTVSGGGYVIVARNQDQAGFEAYWGVTLGPNAVFINSSNRLPQINGDEAYDICDAATNVIEGPTPAAIDPLDKSVHRNNAASDVSDPASWTVLVWSNATPGYGATGSGAGGLVINEYSDAAALSNEFIELYYDQSSGSVYDWFFYNNLIYTNPAAEAVPGLGGAKFFEYSYDYSQPCRMYLLAPHGGITALRTRFWYMDLWGGGTQVYRDGQWLTNVVINSSTPFHGLPASGSVTLEVWRTEFYPPNNCNGMYYEPLILTSMYGAIWLSSVLTNGITATNNWNPPQYFTPEMPGGGRDWSFQPTQAVIRAKSLNTDWMYMNNTNLDPKTESIPGTVIFGEFTGGRFLEVKYASTTTTFYVMTDKPLNLVPGEWPIIVARISHPRSLYDTNYTDNGGWENVFMPGVWVANLRLNAETNFHDLPITGSHTVDLWKVDWNQPAMGGVPVTNEFPVYFSFLLKTMAVEGSGWQTDYTWLIMDGAASNNYPMNPQYYGPDNMGHDFSYLHKWYKVLPDQTIAFPPIGNQDLTNRVGLAASASSGLPVSFTVLSGPAIITGGTNLTFTNTGVGRIAASQAGNTNWNPAPDVTNTFMVTRYIAEVSLMGLSQVYNGSPRVVTATTTPTGLTVDITYDGYGWAPTNAGSYTVTGMVNDAEYRGWATGTLVVGKAAAGVYLSGLSQTYNGTARSVTATTMPAGLTVAITYNGSFGAPIGAGSYAVTGLISEVNYAGVSNAVLTVSKAGQTIAFPPLGTQTLTNHVGLSATASSGLPVSFSVEAPSPALIVGGTNLMFTGRGLVDIVAAQTGTLNWALAPSVTNTFTVLGVYTVQVASAYGTPNPPVGGRVYKEGTIVTNVLSGSPVASGVGTQYSCIGWAMSGQEPSSGTTTGFSMAVTNGARLVWLWTTNVYFERVAVAHGTITGDPNGWYPLGGSVTVTAEPNPGHSFTGWRGACPLDRQHTNPLTLTMDCARAIEATFFANFYVDDYSGNDTNDGLTWASAKKTVQGAADITVDGDTVLVTNGVYSTGVRVTPGGALFNRVAVSNAIAIRSVNGPAYTFIAGVADPTGTNGPAAVRCVYLAAGASLSGFTLTNGYTRIDGDGYKDQCGGGAFAAGAVLSNCVLAGHSAWWMGGGVYGGTLWNCILKDNRNSAAAWSVLYNCLLTGNSANYGGGTYYSTLYNCTLAGNDAQYGGGAYYGTLSNCIAWYNTATYGTNTYGVTAAYSCAPELSGGSNLAVNPLFLDAAAGNYRLQSNSPCINTGQNQGWMTNAVDLDSVPRIRHGLVDMGAYEYNPTAITVTPIRLDFGSVVVGSSSDLVFTVQNFGAETLVGSASVAAPFSAVSGASYSLTNNQSQSVGIRYSPTEAGSHSNNVTFTGGGGATLPVIGGTPVLSVSPSSLGFGMVSVGSSSDLVFTAQNTGNGVLSGSVIVAMPFSAVSNGTYNLGPGQSQVVTIRFSPLWGGDCSNNVVFTGGGGATCPVTGAAPLITVTPAFRDFGAVSAGAYSDLTFTVQNTGFSTLSGDANVAWPFFIIAGGEYNLATGQSQIVVVRYSPATAGYHSNDVIFTGGGGATRPVIGRVPVVHYVWTNSPSPTAPYTNWITASRTIQAAVDVANSNELVLVTNGIYCTGSRVWPGDSTSNRLIIANGISVRGINGSTQTFIVGTGDTRCVYMAAGAYLSGFTLTDGNASGSNYGGGVYADDSAVISNCVLTGNSAYYGGGTYGGTLYNCTLTGNSASNYGGGAYRGTLNNCTISGNSALNYGGGASGGTLNNCIVYYNTAPNGANYTNSVFNYSCTTPDPGGTGNLTNEPVFVDAGTGDYRLQSNSPCVNTGTNQDWMTVAMDLDGNPRIRRGRVDLGAYESDYWGMSADVDDDGFTDYTEAYIAGTDPTNPLSFLGMSIGAFQFSPSATGIVVRWQSVNDKRYRLERSTNLVTDPFVYCVSNNVPGAAPMNTETDKTAVGAGPWLYRIRLTP